MNTIDCPLISVLIPYYNHNRYVVSTLNSVIEDTYPNKEIVIIDDGSTEMDSSNLLDWIENNKENIKIIYKKRENKGITKTLNELIALSSGQYIAVIASDDYFVNNTFAKRVEFLQKHPNKLMLVSDAIVVDDDDSILFNSAMFEQRGALKKRYLSDAGIKKEIIKRWSIVGPTSFIDRRLFDTVGFYDESLMIEDWDFYLRVVAKNLLIFFDEKVAAYRWHATNLSRNKESEYKRDLCLCQTLQKNSKNFSFPYNFLVWKRSRKCFKRLNKN